jgi:NADPH-dependent ferric siderophore reductase
MRKKQNAFAKLSKTRQMPFREVQTMSDAPRVQRVRHELKRRKLVVKRVEQLPPGMVRVVLGGAELAGFTSLGFDDHVKLFFPSATEGEARRDFTPRRFDADTGELWIDFFLHEAGPAAAWAAGVAEGHLLEIGGPKGSSIIDPSDIDMHLLIGDETGLPAVGRRLEELPATARALVVVETEHGVERFALASSATVQTAWVDRDHSATSAAAAIIGTLRRLDFPKAGCFAWIAHESGVARAIRAYLVEERGWDKRWIKAAGYWQRGTTGTHDTISDE